MSFSIELCWTVEHRPIGKKVQLLQYKERKAVQQNIQNTSHESNSFTKKRLGKHRNFYTAFLADTFDGVPLKLVWYALRQQFVPEELVR